MGKCCWDDPDISLDQIFIKLVDNEDRHIISEKIDFGSLLTIG